MNQTSVNKLPVQQGWRTATVIYMKRLCIVVTVFAANFLVLAIVLTVLHLLG